MDDTLCEVSSPKEDLSSGMLKYNYLCNLLFIVKP